MPITKETYHEIKSFIKKYLTDIKLEEQEIDNLEKFFYPTELQHRTILLQVNEPPDNPLTPFILSLHKKSNVIHDDDKIIKLLIKYVAYKHIRNNIKDKENKTKMAFLNDVLRKLQIEAFSIKNKEFKKNKKCTIKITTLAISMLCAIGLYSYLPYYCPSDDCNPYNIILLTLLAVSLTMLGLALCTKLCFDISNKKISYSCKNSYTPDKLISNRSNSFKNLLRHFMLHSENITDIEQLSIQDDSILTPLNN